MLAQQHFNPLRVAIFLAAMAVLSLYPAQAGTIDNRPAALDSILAGAAPGACEPRPASADYLAGTDILGAPVVPADAGSNQIAISVANDVIIPEVLTHLPNLDRVRVQIRVAGLAETVSSASACPNLAPLRSPR